MCPCNIGGNNTLVHVAAVPCLRARGAKQLILFSMCLCVLRAPQRTQNTQTHLLQPGLACGEPHVRDPLQHAQTDGRVDLSEKATGHGS